MVWNGSDYLRIRFCDGVLWKILGSVKGRWFLEQLSDYQIFNKVSAIWSLLVGIIVNEGMEMKSVHLRQLWMFLKMLKKRVSMTTRTG